MKIGDEVLFGTLKGRIAGEPEGGRYAVILEGGEPNWCVRIQPAALKKLKTFKAGDKVKTHLKVDGYVLGPMEGNQYPVGWVNGGVTNATWISPEQLELIDETR